MALRLPVWRSSSVVLQAAPVQDVEAGHGPGIWRPTGNHPQLALEPQAGLAVRGWGWVRIDVELDLLASNHRPRLTWDEVNTPSGRRSLCLAGPSGGRTSLIVHLPTVFQRPRLELMEGQGEFCLGPVRMTKLSPPLALLAILVPHLGGVVRHPRASVRLAAEFLHLYRVRGARGVSATLSHLSLTGSPTEARRHLKASLPGARTGGHGNRGDSSGRLLGDLLSRVTARSSGKRQVVVGLVEHFGDIVACEPVARYLKARTPDAELSWVVRAPFRELIDSNPFVDHTVEVDCLTDWIKLKAHGHFDEIIDLHVNERICQQCNIPLLKVTGNLAITGDTYFHYGSLLESLCQGAGLPPLIDAPKVYLPRAAATAADALELPDAFVVIHSISNETFKDWRQDRWCEVAAWLSRKGLDVVEVGLVSTVPGAVDLCGKTSLLETAEVIRRARLFVGVDSGPAHLANAVGTPGVVLLGQLGRFRTYNPFTGPFADGTNATLVRNESGPAADLTVEQVVRAVEARLSTVSLSVEVPTPCAPTCRMDGLRSRT